MNENTQIKYVIVSVAMTARLYASIRALCLHWRKRHARSAAMVRSQAARHWSVSESDSGAHSLVHAIWLNVAERIFRNFLWENSHLCQVKCFRKRQVCRRFVTTS